MKIKCDSYVNYYKFVMVVEMGMREKKLVVGNRIK
jgi:hypothetical protein